ncbi:MAG: hypothetical protein ACRDI3_08055 [Actinomycetota bacterium]
MDERRVAETLRDGTAAAVPAALLSGVPSTLHALLTDGDPLEASVAAGSILLPRERRRGRLLVAAIPVHLMLSIVWALVLAAVLPRKNPVVEGAVAGLAIAGLDLAVIGRRYPRIRALQPLPQVADHVAFGIIAAVVLARREEARFRP